MSIPLYEDPEKLDINMISYEWLERTNKPKLLKKALKILKDDGNYFPDLYNAIDNKLQTLDLKYKQQKETNNITSEDIEKVKQEMLKFEEEYRNTDKIINDNKELNKFQINYDLIRLERKKEAQNEKIKGNELMKTKEYDEAIKHYTKAISFDEYEPTIYCNRALAYIRNTQYNYGLKDCNKAIDLKHDYIKAYYRRAICLMNIKNFEEAMEDFLYVFNDNPNSNDILNEINTCIEKWKNYDIKDYNKIEKKIKIKINRAKEGKYNGDGNITIEDDKFDKKEGFTKVQIVEGNVDDDKSKEKSVKENNDFKSTDIQKNYKIDLNKKDNKDKFKKIKIIEEDN
jgi:tetratricopeptide (TPR) repeat protein